VALQKIGETYAALRYGPSDAANAGRIVTLRADVAKLPSSRALKGI
jgi:hypothetical protein